MAYSRGRNYRTKGRKSRMRRMKKGGRKKKTQSRRLKTQVSSLRRQVKNMLKSPAVKGKELKNYRCVVNRGQAVSHDVAVGDAAFNQYKVYSSSGEICMAAGLPLGRTFPEFKLLPFITSPDDIFPHVMKGQTINLQSLTVTFDAFWPAIYADQHAYFGGGQTSATTTGAEAEKISPKLCPDVEFLLVRYTSAAGKTAVVGGDQERANHLFADQEYEDLATISGSTKLDVYPNPKRQLYAGRVTGWNPHKAEGFEDVHIVDRKLVKFRQPKWNECIQVVPGNNDTDQSMDVQPLYLVPEVHKRVTLSVKYKSGKKIQLDPIPVAEIVRTSTAPTTPILPTHGAMSFAEHEHYWSTVAADNGFAVVARYAGARLVGKPTGVATEPMHVYMRGGFGEEGTNPFRTHFDQNNGVDVGKIGQIMGSIQWEDCKFSCKYYDE